MNMGSLFQTIKLLSPAITNTKADKLQDSTTAKFFAGAAESKNLTFQSVLSKFMNEKNKTSSNVSSADNTLLNFLNALLFVLSNTSGTDSSGENHAEKSALESWLSGQFKLSQTKSTTVQAVFQSNTTTNPNTGYVPLSDIAEGLKTGKTVTVYLGPFTLELQLLSTGKNGVDREELSQNLSKLFKLLDQFVSANTSENASSPTQKEIDDQSLVHRLPDGSKLRITIKEGELDELPDFSSQLSLINESLSRIAEEKNRKLLPGNPSKSFYVPDAASRKLKEDFTGRNSEISNDLITELKEGISRFTGEHFEFAGERINGVKSQIFVKLLDNENNENDVGNVQIHRAAIETQEYKSMNQTQPDSSREEFKVSQKQYIEKEHLSEQTDNYIKAGLSSSSTARTVSGQAEEIQNHSSNISFQRKNLSNNLLEKTAQTESGSTHQNFSSNPRENQLSELMDRFAKLKLQSIRITPKMSFQPLISEAGVVDQSRIEVQQSSAKVYRDLPSRSPSNPKGLELNKEPQSHQTGERTIASSEVKASGSDKENVVDIAAPNRHSQTLTTINTRVDQIEITSLNQRIQEIMKNALNSRENVISIRFQLVPKELGQIELEIVREAEQSYRVIFTLHRDEAKEIIEKSLPVLRERLKEEGVEHVKFEFTHSREWADDSENEENPNSDHHNQRGGYRRSNSSFKAFLKEVSDNAQLGG